MDVRQRRMSLAGWSCSVVVNTGLGYLGVVPLLLLSSALVNTVGVRLGWAEGSSKFASEDATFQVVVAVVVALFFVLVFLAINLMASRFFKVRGPWYWTSAGLLAVAPFVVATAVPSLWTTIKWY